MLTEKIDVDIIYYEKQKDGLKIIIPIDLENKLRHVGETRGN